jgi:hypothetical protein
VSSIIGQGQNKFFTAQPVLTRDHTNGGYVVVVHDMEEGTTYPLCVVDDLSQAIDAAEDHDIGTDPQATLENALEALIEAGRDFIDGNAHVNTRAVEKLAWAISHVGSQVHAGNVVFRKNPNTHS